MNLFFQQHKQKILIMSLIIATLSIVASLAGLLSGGGTGSVIFESIFGESIETYGVGIYFRDSVSVAAQGLASDLITLVLAVPLLVISAIKAYKGAFKWTLIWLGTTGYFLYTYMSYVFLWFYNPFFIIYVALMSLSLFVFIMLMMSISIDTIKQHFKDTLPVRFIGIYQIAIGALIGLLWLGKIAPTILEGAVPVGLEHYTTLVIQGMDLGFVVPVAILSGILLLKQRPMGYVLTSIVTVKGFTMLLAISAMIINQLINGVSVNIVELILFPLFNLFAIFVFVIFIRQIKSESQGNPS